ncbi:hypothetical protein CFI10_11150 [Marinobacterium iners]|uniref:hypothetical protein n=1 Tax=Marinobacterium iners TaxID=48076 RepID=UPI001A8F4864|nr:hypothetical protein [Marinobacterium iners]QSR35544.1 hypothetical protein CFI10_11150 [Marinobacterium iners]
MSDTTALKGLASAIRKIAWQPEEIRSNLRALRAVGILPEVIATCIAGEEEEGACCNPDSDVPGEDEPPADPDAGTIDGERPDDGNTEKGMDGNFRMPDGTIAPWDNQPCTPDDSWELGRYWRVRNVFGSGIQSRSAGKTTAISDYISAAFCPGCAFDAQSASVTAESCTSKYFCTITITWIEADPPHRSIKSYAYVEHNQCEAMTAAYCQLTEAPCVEDQFWQHDGKCQEALINGAFIPHPKDPDCAGRAPQHYQIMCEGERCVAYVPTADGGHMRVDLDENGQPQGDVRFYGADGKYSDSRSYSKTNFRNNAYDSSTLPQEWVR